MPVVKFTTCLYCVSISLPWIDIDSPVTSKVDPIVVAPVIFVVPDTCKVEVGAEIPIPTFPELFIING